jgi:hypothetical protein
VEVSACLAPYRAVLGNTMPPVKLQPSHGFLQKQFTEKGTITYMNGTIEHSTENALSLIIFGLCEKSLLTILQ